MSGKNKYRRTIETFSQYCHPTEVWKTNKAMGAEKLKNCLCASSDQKTSLRNIDQAVIIVIIWTRMKAF